MINKLTLSTALLTLPLFADYTLDSNFLDQAKQIEKKAEEKSKFNVQKDVVAPSTPTTQVQAAVPAEKKYPTEDIKKAYDKLPIGKYVGKLPNDMYVQLARGSEANQAIQLLHKWEKDKQSPLLKWNGNLQYTYGSGTPLVIIKPANLTDIELEEGEEILDLMLGDNITFQAIPSAHSVDDGLTFISHVIVKCAEADRTTTMIINTNRRSYKIRLVSSSMFTLPHVSFIYPQAEQKEMMDLYNTDLQKYRDAKSMILDELQAAHDLKIKALEEEIIRKETEQIAALEEAKKEEAQEEFKVQQLASPQYLDFNYKINATKGKPTWKPTNCYSDAKKTYIVMPKNMPSQKAPILLIKDSNFRELVNYRLIDNKFVVDRVFDEAVLISGIGKYKKEVTITRLTR